MNLQDHTRVGERSHMPATQFIFAERHLLWAARAMGFEDRRNQAYRMGMFEHVASKRFQRAVGQCLIAGLVPVLLTVICYRLHFNLAMASLLYVVVVVLLARLGNLASSIIASIVAALCLAHLAPPAYSFRMDDPLDDLAVATFLISSLIIARLVFNLRRSAEEALSSVDRRLIDAEERERNRIAGSLHGDVDQRFALLAVNFDQLRRNVPNPTVEVLTRMDELQEQINQISDDIRALAYSVHSPKLELLGLVECVRGFCKEFEHKRKVEIHFKSCDLPTPPPLDNSFALYRVLQEALDNAAKHSAVRQFAVELFQASDTIHLAVSDPGVGFDPKVAKQGSGLGLASMKERLKLVQGTLSIQSKTERGTRIDATVPVNPNR
jgi:signal transduction histidine kinase